jgi:hypothetical protein
MRREPRLIPGVPRPASVIVVLLAAVLLRNSISGLT